MAIARVISREGDRRSSSASTGSSPGGMKIISVWESDEQADAAMQRPEFQGGDEGGRRLA